MTSNPTETMLKRDFLRQLCIAYRFPSPMQEGLVLIIPGMIWFKGHSTHFDPELSRGRSLDHIFNQFLLPAIHRMFPETRLLHLGLGMVRRGPP